MTTYRALILGCCLTVLSGIQAHADDYEAQALIDYREDTMDSIKGHNNAIEAILKGKVPYRDQLDAHMASLEALLGGIGKLFPEGSDFGDTNAKDAIWENPAKFEQTVNDAQKAFADFKKVVAAGDDRASLDAFKQFGKSSCGNCHKSFRKKDDD